MVVVVLGQQTARTELNASEFNGIGFKERALAIAAVFISAEDSVTACASTQATHGTLRVNFANDLHFHQLQRTV